MNKQDSNGVRTAQDIERKYDFKKMLGLDKNVELTEKGLIQIQNTLNEMLNTLVINLKDVLESQSSVSLWFYSGTPDDTNAPYTSWADPSQHYGDLYYDTDAGKVYQFYEVDEYTSGTYIYGVHGMWDANANPDLLRAMAITNSEIDASIDHERKVFFQTPAPPYSSGDWWIKDDGSLFICQIGKASGTYEEQDFINSSNYTPTIAESFDDVIEVLKGTITTLSEDCVRFTDLSTGGSTTIAGENIKTGNIESNNYVQDTSGMKINLLQGTIDTKNFKTDTQGNIMMGSGAKVIGGDGLLSNLEVEGVFGVESFEATLRGTELINIGFDGNYNGDVQKTYMDFFVYIPSNFKIEKAFVTLTHMPTKMSYMGNAFWCWGRQLKLAGAKADSTAYYNIKFMSDLANLSVTTSEIKDANNKNALSQTTTGYTFPEPTDSSHALSTITSDDLMDSKYPSMLESGKFSLIRVYTAMTSPIVSGNFNISDYNQVKTLYEKNGFCLGKLNIYGYMPYS